MYESVLHIVLTDKGQTASDLPTTQKAINNFDFVTGVFQYAVNLLS